MGSAAATEGPVALLARRGAVPSARPKDLDLSVSVVLVDANAVAAPESLDLSVLLHPK